MTVEPYYRELIAGVKPWPDQWRQRELVRETRQVLATVLAAPRKSLTQVLETPGNERIVLSILCDLPQGLYQEWLASGSRDLQAALISRLELLKALSLSNATQAARRDAALELILEQLDRFVGWEHLCLRSQDYQLQSEQAWWHPSGSFFQSEEIRRSLHSRKQLEEAGFLRLYREAYLQRVREPIVFNLIQKGRELERLAAIIALYTAPSKKLFEDATGWVEHTLDDLRRELTRELTRRDFTAVPMKPLYSLPRESNNIRHFFISREEDIKIAPSRQVLQGNLPRARVKFMEEESGQQALFFDTHLVNKVSGEPDSFISVKLDSPQIDVLGALTQAIEQLDVDPTVFEHLPRICAGMFAAAHRDRALFGSSEGTFWDTDSGKRLCKIVGFNADNYKHRQRVQHVRKLLGKLILHRSATGYDEQGRKMRIRRRGPLIELRQAEIELEIENREGMSEKHTFQSWTIDDTLWQMTLSKDEGGAPAFMMLDDRAFKLDDRSSVAFNIYWTLVNRAYNDRVSDSGEFELNLWTLYDWAGIEQSSPRVDRLKETFNTALHRMVEIGLLCSWRCEPLSEQALSTMDVLRDARLSVVFGQTQLKMLPKLS